MATLSPAPWRLQESRYASANGKAHLYIVDGNGRKIAALWGPQDEKLNNGIAICDLINNAALKP